MRILKSTIVLLAGLKCASGAFLPPSGGRIAARFRAAAPPGGISVEADAADKGEMEAFQNRGKVNEIDFCMAPSDVSLSRSYGSSASAYASLDLETSDSAGEQEVKTLSLTRALNTASNRAVRRIILSRSWPSAEALNLSLRQVLASGRSDDNSGGGDEAQETAVTAGDASTAKCPVPRPILNIIMRRKDDKNSIYSSDRTLVSTPDEPQSVDEPITRSSSKRGRSDAEWVADQIQAFRDSYGALPGYNLAEAYLECILSLATSGVESPRVTEVLAAGVYDEPYRRFLAVLKSVGAILEQVPDSDPPLTRIAPKLVDRDICLSIMDKISLKKESQPRKALKSDKSDTMGKSEPSVEGRKEASESLISGREVSTDSPSVESLSAVDDSVSLKKKRNKRIRLRFWRKNDYSDMEEGVGAVGNDTATYAPDVVSDSAKEEVETSISPEDLGAVLLSAEEPSMTRQLNVLSNIVQRALLFGGDQELLVLSETLAADKPAFVQRWYPDSGGALENDKLSDEHNPGVQYLQCLIQLLETTYREGVIRDLDPPLPLVQSYSNAYERLTASLVELGSGYAKPITAKNLLSAPPKSAKEEFGRFALWEASVRKNSPDVSAYPDDLVGSWQVKDEVGGNVIGKSTVVFKPQGEVVVAPPMQGLRWRLDPGPTHLDTCTFQILAYDGAILQYKGFVDRGARLEARFSKRSIKIRGAVTFQMRDGDSVRMGEGYRKDMLPVDYKTGTTRFVMSQIVRGEDDMMEPAKLGKDMTSAK